MREDTVLNFEDKDTGLLTVSCTSLILLLAVQQWGHPSCVVHSTSVKVNHLS